MALAVIAMFAAVGVEGVAAEDPPGYEPGDVVAALRRVLAVEGLGADARAALERALQGSGQDIVHLKLTLGPGTRISECSGMSVVVVLVGSGMSACVGEPEECSRKNFVALIIVGDYNEVCSGQESACSDNFFVLSVIAGSYNLVCGAEQTGVGYDLDSR